MKENSFDFNLNTKYFSVFKEGKKVIINVWRPTTEGKKLMYIYPNGKKRHDMKKTGEIWRKK